MKEERLVPVLVYLEPIQLLKLLRVRQFACPDESWDKTIGDAISIALGEYEKLAAERSNTSTPRGEER